MLRHISSCLDSQAGEETHQGYRYLRCNTRKEFVFVFWGAQTSWIWRFFRFAPCSWGDTRGYDKTLLFDVSGFENVMVCSSRKPAAGCFNGSTRLRTPFAPFSICFYNSWLVSLETHLESVLFLFCALPAQPRSFFSCLKKYLRSTDTQYIWSIRV